jgi:hypothetical protein
VIPRHLDWAFQEGRTLRTCVGTGPTTLRRLADLVLPTGRLLLGYPSSPHVNDPSPVRPTVAPGCYPVFASLVNSKGRKSLAFVAVRFEDVAPAAWEEAGSFFTDSGLGCLMDESCIPLLESLRTNAPDFWRLLSEAKMGVFADGDCNLLLEPTTGANAIVFKTFDARYPCFLGKSGPEPQSACPVCLVVDCR